MSKCAYRDFCTKTICDKACPTLVESNYLYERNGFTDSSTVLWEKPSAFDPVLPVLHSEYNLAVTVTDDTVRTANLLTYAAISENWKGSRLHCTVYHLRLSTYIDNLQKSWGMKEAPEQLEYEQIWLTTAKILIVSNMDYVQFKDFQAQTLLNIIQNRTSNGLKTIIVSPKIEHLIGQGMFYSRLQGILREAVIK